MKNIRDTVSCNIFCRPGLRASLTGKPEVSEHPLRVLDTNLDICTL